MNRFHLNKSLFLTVLPVLLITLTSACSDDQSANMDTGKPMVAGEVNESVAMEKNSSSGGSPSVHPVLDGIERAEGVVYMDEIYKK